MLMADGGGIGSYIRSADSEAVKAGKTVAGDIGFDAAGFDKVIQRLEDVIDQQEQHKARATRSERRQQRTGFETQAAEDYASNGYAASADKFEENYEKWSDEYVKRLQQTVEKFKKVKAHYMAREDAIGEQFRSGLKK